MSVDGIKELDRKLDVLRDAAQLEKIVGKAIQTVRSEAVLRCPVNDGELRQSIYAEVYQENESVIGECWTDKAYAPYVELGTGPKGQENHRGISPEINPAYVQSPWWIHESQIDRDTAEKYHWFYIDTPEGRFYQCTGQPAQPFMYPALKDNQDTILKNMEAEFRVSIKEAVK